MDTHDDLLLRVEEQAPGFGGMFLDPSGGLVIYLLDVSRLPAARDAIEAVFGAGRIPPGGVRALQGRYTVSQLKRWTDLATTLLALPEVNRVDLDEAGNRVAIGIDNERVQPAVEKALRSLGIPGDAGLIRLSI